MRLEPPPSPAFLREMPREPGRAPGRSATVWLLRHGQVASEYSGTAYGSQDVPLSPEGVQQSQATGACFQEQPAHPPVDRVVSSPLQRALHLGQAVAAASGAPLVVDERLAELDRGAWQGLPREDYRTRWEEQAEQYWRDPASWRGHGGETERELAERTWAAFEQALEGAQNVVISAHQNVVRSIVASALGLPHGRSHGLLTDPGHGALLLDGPHGWALALSNRGPEPGP